MVTVTEEHFKELLDRDTGAEYGYYIQAKSTQAGSLSTWLEGIVGWVDNKKGGNT